VETSSADVGYMTRPWNKVLHKWSPSQKGFFYDEHNAYGVSFSQEAPAFETAGIIK
jgi:hypothetical protein